MRRLGGAPTYVLTDNEKTVTVEHVAGIAVRNPQMVAFARHYGVTVHTCEPADPASKGGSESTVKLAKADLVPKDTNLLGEYASFAALEAACAVFCGQVNGRVHRVTRRVPAEMLAEEQARLHRLPAVPHTVAFGVTRTVAAKTPMVAFEGGQYSVPWPLLGQPVWVRVHGTGDDEQVIVVHVGEAGPGRGRPPCPRDTGQPAAGRRAFPARSGRRALRGRPKARTAAEAEFLALGNGARLWLTEAAAAGTARMRVQDGRRGHDRQARRGGRGRLGARACRGQRPLRRG